MKKFKLFLVSILLISVSFNCFAFGAKEKDNSKLNVLATFYPIYDFTKQIAQDKINLSILIPFNIEPHGFELRTQDMIKIENSDIVFYNSLYFEGFLKDIIQNSSDKEKFVEVSKEVNLLKTNFRCNHDHHSCCSFHNCKKHHEHNDSCCDHKDCKDHEHHSVLKSSELNLSTEKLDSFDPHTWLSPNNAKRMCKVICDTLCEKDKENSSFYKENYIQVLNKLNDLDNKYRQELKNLSKKDIVVSHMAFGYLAHDYNFNQVALRGLDSDSEPSSQDLAKILDFVKQNNIKVIFCEDFVSPKLSNIIAKDAKAEVMVLSPINGLTDEQVKNNDDYYSIMYRNLDKIKEALK